MVHGSDWRYHCQTTAHCVEVANDGIHAVEENGDASLRLVPVITATFCVASLTGITEETAGGSLAT